MLFRKRKKKGAEDASEVVESAVVSAGNPVIVYGGDGKDAQVVDATAAQQTQEKSATETAAPAAEQAVAEQAASSAAPAQAVAEAAAPAAQAAVPAASAEATLAPQPAEQAAQGAPAESAQSAAAPASNPVIAAKEAGKTDQEAPAAQPAAAQPNAPTEAPQAATPAETPQPAAGGSIDAATWERVVSIAQKLESSPTSNVELAGLAMELERIAAQNAASESTYAAQAAKAQGRDATYRAQAVQAAEAKRAAEVADQAAKQATPEAAASAQAPAQAAAQAASAASASVEASASAQSAAQHEGVLPDWAPSDDSAQDLVDSFFNAPVEGDAANPFVIPRGQHVETQKPLVFRGAMADAASEEAATAAQAAKAATPAAQAATPAASAEAPTPTEAPASAATEESTPAGHVIKLESLGSTEVAPLSSALSGKPAAEPISFASIASEAAKKAESAPAAAEPAASTAAAESAAPEGAADQEISFLEAERSIGLSVSEMVHLESLGEALKQQMQETAASEEKEEPAVPHAEKTISLDSGKGEQIGSISEALGRTSAATQSESRILPSSLVTEAPASQSAVQETSPVDAAAAAASAFTRTISEPLPRIAVDASGKPSVAEPAQAEDDEIVKSLFAAEREAEAKKQAERAAIQAAAAVAAEYEPQEGAFAISADQAAPAFTPDGALASDAMGDEVDIAAEAPAVEPAPEAEAREQRQYAGFPEQEAAGALDSTEPRAANVPSFVYVTAPAFEPEQGFERKTKPTYERDRHAAADYEAERKAAQLRNRVTSDLTAPVEAPIPDFGTPHPPVDFDAFEEKPKKEKKKKDKGKKDKKGKKKKGKKGKKMKKDKDDKRDKHKRDDEAPATFRQLYTSRDGKLAIYEDAEGHIISVDTNRLV